MMILQVPVQVRVQRRNRQVQKYDDELFKHVEANARIHKASELMPFQNLDQKFIENFVPISERTVEIMYYITYAIEAIILKTLYDDYYDDINDDS